MKLRSVPVFIGGILLAMASLVHFFNGYPAINNMLESINSSTELTQSVRIIWIFSSITMFLCGVWGISIGNAMRKGNTSQWPGIILGSGISFFGLIGFFIGFPNFHMLTFAVPGLLILLPSIFYDQQPVP